MRSERRKVQVIGEATTDDEMKAIHKYEQAKKRIYKKLKGHLKYENLIEAKRSSIGIYNGVDSTSDSSKNAQRLTRFASIDNDRNDQFLNFDFCCSKLTSNVDSRVHLDRVDCKFI